MALINFESPVYLFFLFSIPFIIFSHFFFLKSRRKKALKFANFDAIASIKGVDFFSKNIFVLGISCLIIIFISLSLAGTSIEMTRPASSFSFVIAIDSSKSMEATDIPPSRIEAAKSTAIDFIDSAPLGTKIGVISFSGNSLIEHKISDDKLSLKDSIRNINITFVGGTNIYNAILSSSILLENFDEKAVVILSDGQINTGNLEQSIDYASRNNIVIHTIGIGTSEGGDTTYGLSKLDADTLNSISAATHGEYSLARNKEEISSSFKNILDLKNVISRIDISRQLLIAAIVLILIEFVLVNTRFSVFP